MDENEIMAVLEAVIIRDSLTLYMNRVTEQHRTHPDYQATMQFIGSIYKKYARIADQRVIRNEIGQTVLRRDIRSKFDLN